jgi:hypothetical protein
MKCEEAERWLMDYLDQSLDEDQKGELEKHLAICERCRDEVSDFRQIIDPIDSSSMEMPEESLRINFYHMLHAEINKQALEETRPGKSAQPFFSSKVMIRLAASVALLLAGSFIGYFIQSAASHRKSESRISELSNEVHSMKKLMMLAMLKEESPSDRIQAVNYTDDIPSPDAGVLEALTKTLNHDRNVNVRMAAAYSLARYADRQSVRDSLVASLSQQTEPIIQVVLMNILVEKKESNAIQPMQRIVRDDKTLKEVKDVAAKGLKVLL